MPLMQFTNKVGPDQPVQAEAELGLCFPLAEWMDTVVYVVKQRMSRSDSAHAHLGPVVQN